VISRIALMLAVAGGVFMLVAGALRLRDATAKADAEHRALLLASGDARQVLQLQATTARVADAQRPKQDVIARVNEALAAAGIPARTLTDLREEGDITIDEGPPELRRQTLAATLEPIMLDQLGRFLEQWRSSQPLWTVTRIDISHKGKDDEPTLTCRLVFAATYLAGP
jgi:hypothetical protein